MKILSAEIAQREFYKVLIDVNDNHEPIAIHGSNKNNSAVILSYAEWTGIQETLKLEQMGVMNKVRTRENDDSGFTEIEEINWDKV